MKLLWVKRPVPDNYVDQSFMSQLRRNQNVIRYSFLTLASDASVLLTSLALALMFIMAFIAIYVHNWNPRYFVVGGSLVDGVLAQRWARTQSFPKRIEAFKSMTLTLFTVMALTPVFRSLTESTSSDSIWAITGWLLLTNVAVASRSLLALSNNTALAATIVLASRLQTSISVFHFVLFSIQTFVTLPTAHKWLRTSESRQEWSWGLCALSSISSSILLLVLLGPLMLILWVITQSLVLLGIPTLFLALQKYKDRISGPWDPAKFTLD